MALIVPPSQSMVQGVSAGAPPTLKRIHGEGGFFYEQGVGPQANIEDGIIRRDRRRVRRTRSKCHI